MKPGIHPEYKEVVVVMSDGSEVMMKSTLKTKNGRYTTEVDSKNHPFYIGSKKMISAAGRVDKFNERYKKK
jgi:large subunit ribosomal protein L31